jgi:hypothetical protein
MVQIVLGVYLISSLDDFSQSADSDYALPQSETIKVAKDIADNTMSRKEGKSIIGYAGGNLKSMLHDIFSDDEKERGGHNLDSFLNTKKNKKQDSIREEVQYL